MFDTITSKQKQKTGSKDFLLSRRSLLFNKPLRPIGLINSNI